MGRDLYIAARTIWRLTVLVGCTWLWLLAVRGGLHVITGTPWQPDRADALMLVVGALLTSTGVAWTVLEGWSEGR